MRPWQSFPVTSTPEGSDMANFDIRMDVVHKAGYDKTSAAIWLAGHQNLLAPDWIMEMAKTDPDIIYHDAAGKQAPLADEGSARERYQPLNIFHPRVHKLACDLARDLAREIKKWPREQVGWYEYALENYNFFGVGNDLREIGYGLAAGKAFHDYLRGKFDTIEKLNAAWGSQYASFEDIKQPQDKWIEERHTSSPLIYEFESFIDDGYLNHLKGIYEAFKEVDPERPVMIDPTVLLWDLNGARLFECCDLFSVHTSHPTCAVQSEYIKTLKRYCGKGICYSEN